jgi:hypothetical protein
MVGDPGRQRARLLAVAAGIFRGVDVLGDGNPGFVWALLQDTTPVGAQRAIARLAEAFGAREIWVGHASLDADDTVVTASARAERALSAAKKLGEGSVRSDQVRRVA